MSPEKTSAEASAGEAAVTLMASPVEPRLDGVGVEQRAARTFAALAARGPLELKVCGPGARLEPLAAEPLLRRAALMAPRSTLLTRATELAGRLLPQLPQLAWPTVRRAAALRFFSFRLACADALPAKAAARREIDLDDLESQAARSIAELAARRGDHAIAALYRVLAERLAALEASRLPRFDRAYVGSAADRAWLAARHPRLDIRVLPNVVDPVGEPRAARPPGPTRLLFVGALGYYPNIDALRVLAERIVPLLSRLRRAPFELHVVGRGAPRWLERRLRHPNIVYHGAAPAMAPHYRRADAVVVPLFAGGGTRIKLLEAFAQRVPVISSALGAFGLEVEAGRHLYLAERDEEFAELCARFIDDPEHAAALADEAERLVVARHHPQILSACLEA